MTEMAGELGRITAERIQAELTKLLLGDAPRRGLELLVDTGLAEVVLPELPALRMTADEHGQHKDVYAHTLQVLDQAIEHERAAGRRRTWAALGGAAARRRQAGHPRVPTTAGRSLPPPRGGRRPAGPQPAPGAAVLATQIVDDVSQLVFLHLRFYGYRDGGWTDSAVRRYVVDAGPLLARLHKLVRSDTTTRNQRQAAALARAYDDLEQRIAELREQEELARSGRTSTATRSCGCSTSRPARWSAAPTSTCWPCGWSTDRCRTTTPSRPTRVVRRAVC